MAESSLLTGYETFLAASPADGLERITESHPPRGDVYQCLRHWLINTPLPIGHRLRVGDLADHLGLSSTPVREALIRLSGDGLVKLKPGEGFFTLEPSLEEAHDLFETCHLLTIGSLGNQVDRGLITGFELKLPSFETLDSDQSAMLTALMQEAFHGAVSRLTGNSVIEQVMGVVNGRLRLLRVVGAKDQAVAAESLGRLQAVSSAIRKGESDAAIDLLNQYHVAIINRLADAVERLILCGFKTTFTLPSARASSAPSHSRRTNRL